MYTKIANNNPTKIIKSLYIGIDKCSEKAICPAKISGMSEYSGKVPKTIAVSSLKNKISPKDTRTCSKWSLF